MSEIIISLKERDVKGDTTRENLVQAIGLLQQSLKESLSREYALFREQVELLGISIEELSRMQRRSVVTTYTHPLDPTKIWQGRGRRPGWVTAFFPEVSGKHTAANGGKKGTGSKAAEPKERGRPEAESAADKATSGGTTRTADEKAAE